MLRAAMHCDGPCVNVNVCEAESGNYPAHSKKNNCHWRCLLCLISANLRNWVGGNEHQIIISTRQRDGLLAGSGKAYTRDCYPKHNKKRLEHHLNRNVRNVRVRGNCFAMDTHKRLGCVFFPTCRLSVFVSLSALCAIDFWCVSVLCTNVSAHKWGTNGRRLNGHNQQRCGTINQSAVRALNSYLLDIRRA